MKRTLVALERQHLEQPDLDDGGGHPDLVRQPMVLGELVLITRSDGDRTERVVHPG